MGQTLVKGDTAVTSSMAKKGRPILRQRMLRTRDNGRADGIRSRRGGSCTLGVKMQRKLRTRDNGRADGIRSGRGGSCTLGVRIFSRS